MWECSKMTIWKDYEGNTTETFKLRTNKGSETLRRILDAGTQCSC